MLRVIINILFLVLFISLIRRLLRGGSKLRQRFSSKRPGQDQPPYKKEDYSDLTPYEIEDADFDEFRGKGK